MSRCCQYETSLPLLFVTMINRNMKRSPVLDFLVKPSLFATFAILRICKVPRERTSCVRWHGGMSSSLGLQLIWIFCFVPLMIARVRWLFSAQIEQAERVSSGEIPAGWYDPDQEYPQTEEEEYEDVTVSRGKARDLLRIIVFYV